MSTTGNRMMKAVRIHAYATSPVIEDVALPEIGPDTVIVRVAAIGLNPLDVKLQLGAMREVFPLVLRFQS